MLSLILQVFLEKFLARKHPPDTQPLFDSPLSSPQRAGRRKGRQFLDVEAELSEEGEAGVSSDEDDDEELNRSLEGFVVNNTECSQGLNGKTSMWLLVKEIIEFVGLNQSVHPVACLRPLLADSEMHCVYMKSVRSPAVQAKFKMSYRNHHNMDIFSQVCS